MHLNHNRKTVWTMYIWVRLCISVNTNVTLQINVCLKQLPTVRTEIWSSVVVYCKLLDWVKHLCYTVNNCVRLSPLWTLMWVFTMLVCPRCGHEYVHGGSGQPCSYTVPRSKDSDMVFCCCVQKVCVASSCMIDWNICHTVNTCTVCLPCGLSYACVDLRTHWRPCHTSDICTVSLLSVCLEHRAYQRPCHTTDISLSYELSCVCSDFRTD